MEAIEPGQSYGGGLSEYDVRRGGGEEDNVFISSAE